MRAWWWCSDFRPSPPPTLLGTQLTHAWARGDFITIVQLQSFGQAFTLLPIIIIAVSNSDPTRATAFAAYIQIMRLGGAEIGVALMGTWLRVREQVHSNFSGSTSKTVASMSRTCCGSSHRAFASHGVSLAPARALGILSALVQREANVLAYTDGFWLCFWLAIAGAALVSLMTRAPQGPFTPEPFGAAKAVLRKCGVAVR